MQNTVFLCPYVPTLYRYLPEDCVNMFFNVGILRLSSFEKFRKHKDEARLDTQEGIATIKASCSDSNMSLESKMGASDNRFILCTSSLYSKEMEKIFNVNACIEIFKPIDFMIAISDKLIQMGYPVDRVVFGPCCYKDNREIHSIISQSDIDNIEKDPFALFSLNNKVADDDILFLKTNNYCNQHEYRIIWEIKGNNVPEYLDLCVKEVTEFCRKIGE